MKKDIIGAMTNNVHEKTSAEFEKIVQEAHKKDMMSHSSTPNCQINQISQRSIKRIQVELGIKDGNAEQTTDARERACADKINAISTAVAHHAMVPLTSPYLLFNADGTSFQTGGGHTDLVKVKYLPYDWEAKNGRPLKVAPRRMVSLYLSSSSITYSLMLWVILGRLFILLQTLTWRSIL